MSQSITDTEAAKRLRELRAVAEEALATGKNAQGRSLIGWGDEATNADGVVFRSAEDKEYFLVGLRHARKVVADRGTTPPFFGMLDEAQDIISGTNELVALLGAPMAGTTPGPAEPPKDETSGAMLLALLLVGIVAGMAA